MSEQNATAKVEVEAKVTATTKIAVEAKVNKKLLYFKIKY
jgi:hypothetical protein